VQEIRSSTCDDLPDKTWSKMRPAESERRLPFKKGKKGDHTAYAHAGTCGKRCRPYAPVEYSEENKFQHSAQYGHQEIDEQTAAYISADAQEIVHRENDRCHRGAERVDPQILYCEIREISFCSHKPDQERRRSKKSGADQYSGGDDHNACTGKEVVCFRLLLFPQTDRNGYRRTNTDEV